MHLDSGSTCRGVLISIDQAVRPGSLRWPRMLSSLKKCDLGQRCSWTPNHSLLHVAWLACHFKTLVSFKQAQPVDSDPNKNRPGPETLKRLFVVCLYFFSNRFFPKQFTVGVLFKQCTVGVYAGSFLREISMFLYVHSLILFSLSFSSRGTRASERCRGADGGAPAGFGSNSCHRKVGTGGMGR